MKLIAIALHGLGKQFLSLLMIVLILVAGSYLILVMVLFVINQSFSPFLRFYG